VDDLRDEHDLAVTAEVDELWRLTERAIARLPRAERLVLLLYYLRGATKDEVARTLRLTQSRASQLHHSALGRLRLRMRRFAP
jgi:RNA polymerase sigma factor (sigma-70 family)